MNSRIFDSTVGRFCSVDPFIDNAKNVQSYNRYSYVNNSPLNYVDPSGYFKIWDDPLKPIVDFAAAVYGGPILNLLYGYATGGADGAVLQYARMLGAHAGAFGGPVGTEAGVTH